MVCLSGWRVRPPETLDVSSGSSQSSDRVPAFDGLRGVAILSVMIFHFVIFRISFDEIRPGELGGDAGLTLLQLSMCGWAGVDLFFVLSGFLITRILLNARGRAGYFRVFYFRRILRIFPAYYAALVVLLVIPRLFPSLVRGVAHIHSSIWLWTYLSNVLLATHGWDSVPETMQHFWSLAIEEQFYLLWPWLIFVLSRRRAIWVCVLLMVGAPLLRAFLMSTGNPTAGYVLTPARVDTLAAGALLALWAQSEAEWSRVLRGIRVAGLLSLAVLVALFATHGHAMFGHRFIYRDPYMLTIGFSAIAVASMAWIGLCFLPPSPTVLQRVTAFPALRYFGRYSYGLYIVHQPVAAFLWSSGVMQGSLRLSRQWLPPVLAGFVPTVLLPLALSTAGALVSWYAGD